MFRHWRELALSALFVLAIVVLPTHAIAASTWYANSATGNDTTGDGSSGNPYQTFYKAYTAASAGDTLNLTGTFDWTNAGETGDVTTSGFTINKNLTIQGQTATSTFIQAASSATTTDRGIFTIGSAVSAVTFQDVTLRYGYTPSGSTIGNAIEDQYASLTLNRVIIDHNQSAGTYTNGSFGAVDFSGGSTRVLTVRNSVFSNNGDVANNTSYAGGIYVYINSTNTANEITNTTFYRNGGAYYGAVYDRGIVHVTNSTFIGNHGGVSCTDVCPYGTATAYIKNNIFAGKYAGQQSLVSGASASGGAIVDNGNNLIETYSGGTFTNGVNGDIVGVQSNLNIATTTGPTDNGGSMLTMPLLTGSVAIDAGSTGTNDTVNVPSTDARAYYRTATPDMGAYEYSATQSPPTITAPTTAASNVAVGSIQQGSATITWNNGNGAARVVFMKLGSSGDSSPTNSTTYTASNGFGSGTQIGSTGWYAVYNGTSTNVIVSNLSAANAYRVHVVEYNGYVGGESYQTAGISATTTKAVYAGSTLYANYSAGNDTSGDGSSGNPYKTFNKVYAMAADNDTLDLTGTFVWTNVDETGDSATTGYTINKYNLTVQGHGPAASIVESATTDNTATERIFTLPASTTLTIKNLEMRYGKATVAGGCINLSATSTLILSGTDMSNCRSTSGGGGAISGSGTGMTLSVQNASFTGNNVGTTGYGGAIALNGASTTVTITNTTLTGNTSNNTGGYGGAALWTNGTGGAIYLTNDTITNNYTYLGAVNVSTGSFVKIKNTIIANNISSSASDANLYGSASSILSNGYNIIGIYSSAYATTTGDWTDRTGSGTYKLYSAGTTGTLTMDATQAYHQSVHILEVANRSSSSPNY